MSTKQKKVYWKNRYRRLKKLRDEQKPPDPIEAISALNLAYIAGLIDGEGSISICSASNGKFQPTLQVIMSTKPVLEWLAGELGCTCKNRKYTKKKPTYRDQFEVRLTGKRASILLGRLLSYLKVKKEQALVLIQFVATYQWSHAHGPNGWGVPPEVRQKRLELKQGMQALNQGKRHQKEPVSDMRIL